MLNTEFEIVGDALVLRLQGELDILSASKFRDITDKALDSFNPKTLILNIKGVTFIDSSGLGAILGRYRRMTQRQANMVIVGATPKIRPVLELSGILRIMRLCESEKGILEA